LDCGDKRSATSLSIFPRFNGSTIQRMTLGAFLKIPMAPFGRSQRDEIRTPTPCPLRCNANKWLKAGLPNAELTCHRPSAFQNMRGFSWLPM
jgi:hypothetical protein